jgi:NADH-ubiquinone oxidoreductase chain 5
VTAFFAGTTGLLQNDMKRVIAYSTCSQMGYLFMAVGLSQYSLALFHLVNHAFFKAVLFLAAGGVLHSMADQQDMRRLGGLINLLPFTYTVILTGSLSLMAVPFLTGFYSKDLILESGVAAYSLSGHLVYVLGTITALLTSFYSFRLISMTFLTTANAPRTGYEQCHEQDSLTVLPLLVLATLSIFFGYVAKDSFVGMGSDLFSTALLALPGHVTLVEAEFGVPTVIKLLPAIGTVLAAMLALTMYHSMASFTVDLTAGFGKVLYSFFNAKWYFDALINHYVIGQSLALGLVTANVLDRGAIELLGPKGLTDSLKAASGQLARMDSGVLTHYALYMMVALLVLVAVLFLPVSSSLVFYVPAIAIALVL